MMPELDRHFTYLGEALAAARAAPLSAKRAMLVAMLADAYADRLFEGDPGDGDILEFRESLAQRSPTLALVFALVAARPDAPHLVTEAVEVPLADYPKLGVEDFMVSLYNDHTVQRVRLALPDGARLLVHDVLDEAVAFLREI